MTGHEPSQDDLVGPSGRGGADEDPALAGSLRRAGTAVDPPPPELRDAARAAFAWRDPDSALADLVYDSSDDRDALAGVRGAGASRLLAFEYSEITVEFEVTRGGRGYRIVGHVVPPAPGRVEVRHAQGSMDLDVDELGHFAAGLLPKGPISVRWTPLDGVTVATEWVRI
ncbi:hypothetical protein ER308_03865 [Egibacter rhizosphaerae]|uniref:Uncharacterized protein n=1 Tax=Egibacter rhizosphaerae TaxID=1670831 RepID=A0A411YC41_9ACTN|nr:hypothetical protein [Egibacter rhizosphaerae]QBI18770.1 hypothetical protein ER308_03865 [Egibacter rhizosphaerae]